jgi:hypothetical protein
VELNSGRDIPEIVVRQDLSWEGVMALPQFFCAADQLTADGVADWAGTNTCLSHSHGVHPQSFSGAETSRSYQVLSTFFANDIRC